MDQAIQNAQAIMFELQSLLVDIQKYHGQQDTEVRNLLITRAKAKANELAALFP